MKRGDIILVASRHDASAVRPCLVVQSDLYNECHPAITICPVTSRLTGDGLYRVAVAGGDETGLRRDSEVEVDLMQAIRRERLRQVIGTVPEPVMTMVDDALRRWLAL